jgi:hypothetical protein
MKHSIRTLTLTTLALLVSLAITARANGGDRFSISASLYGNGAVHLQPNEPPPGTLWYNGDFDGIDGLTNEDNTSLGSGQFSHIYDDFIVTDSGGWDVTALFSDNLADTNITSATWEIRQNVSGGVGGDLLFFGSGTPVVTLTGRSGFGFLEYQVLIDGLSIHLDPGTYWLNVTPVGDLTGRSFDSTTSGADCVGSPCGDDDTAFLDSNFFGANFEPVADFGSQFHDFSMGVIGTVASGEFELKNAVSKKAKFEIELPGVEDRIGGPNNTYQIIFTFSNTLASVGSADVTGCPGAVVSSATINSKDAHQFIVTLTNVTCDQQEITITLNRVSDTLGNHLASATTTMGLLIGDVNGDGTGDISDVHQITTDQGQTVTQDNFRDDVNVDAFITRTDAQLVKSHLGDSLP